MIFTDSLYPILSIIFIHLDDKNLVVLSRVNGVIRRCILNGLATNIRVNRYIVSKIVDRGLDMIELRGRDYRRRRGSLAWIFQKSCIGTSSISVYIEINLMCEENGPIVKEKLQQLDNMKSYLKSIEGPQNNNFFLDKTWITTRSVRGYVLKILLDLSNKCTFQTNSITRNSFGITTMNFSTLVFTLTHDSYMKMMDRVRVEGKTNGDFI